jgi:hypothetical protein
MTTRRKPTATRRRTSACSSPGGASTGAYTLIMCELQRPGPSSRPERPQAEQADHTVACGEQVPGVAGGQVPFGQLGQVFGGDPAGRAEERPRPDDLLLLALCFVAGPGAPRRPLSPSPPSKRIRNPSRMRPAGRRPRGGPSFSRRRAPRRSRALAGGASVGRGSGGRSAPRPKRRGATPEPMAKGHGGPPDPKGSVYNCTFRNFLHLSR